MKSAWPNSRCPLHASCDFDDDVVIMMVMVVIGKVVDGRDDGDGDLVPEHL